MLNPEAVRMWFMLGILHIPNQSIALEYRYMQNHISMTKDSFMTALWSSLFSRLSPKITEIYLSAECFSLVDLQINQTI